MAAVGPARVFGLPDVDGGEEIHDVDATIADLVRAYPTLAKLVDRDDGIAHGAAVFKLVPGRDYDAVFAAPVVPQGAPGTCIVWQRLCPL